MSNVYYKLFRKKLDGSLEYRTYPSAALAIQYGVLMGFDFDLYAANDRAPEMHMLTIDKENGNYFFNDEIKDGYYKIFNHYENAA